MTTYESDRPESAIEPQLEASNGGRLDPHLTVEEASQEPVVDARLQGDRANTSSVDYISQVHGHDAQVLSHGIDTGLDWPMRAACSRNVASSPGHDATLGEGGDPGSTRQHSVLEIPSSDCGDSYPHLDEEVLQVVMDYTPRLPDDEWEAIADFVRNAVATAGPERIDTARTWMTAVTMLAHFCHQVACMELTVESVFHADSIERFVQQIESPSKSTKSSYRSYLFRVATRLVGHQEQSHLRNSIARWEPADAYSRDELSALRFAQRSHRTAYRKVQMGALMGLGLGAGLTSGEMLRLRQSDVKKEGDGLLVTVTGNERRNSRPVPVLASWEDLVVPVLDDSDPDARLLMPRRVTDNPTGISNFLARCEEKGLVPNMWRMRATWIVTHLNAGTPLPDLVDAAGIDSLTRFERFLPFLTRLPDDLRSAYMRNVEDVR